MISAFVARRMSRGGRAAGRTSGGPWVRQASGPTPVRVEPLPKRTSAPPHNNPTPTHAGPAQNLGAAAQQSHANPRQAPPKTSAPPHNNPTPAHAGARAKPRRRRGASPRQSTRDSREPVRGAHAIRRIAWLGPQLPTVAGASLPRPTPLPAQAKPGPLDGTCHDPVHQVWDLDGVSPRSTTPDHENTGPDKIRCSRSGRHAAQIPDLPHPITPGAGPLWPGTAWIGHPVARRPQSPRSKTVTGGGAKRRLPVGDLGSRHVSPFATWRAWQAGQSRTAASASPTRLRRAPPAARHQPTAGRRAAAARQPERRAPPVTQCTLARRAMHSHGRDVGSGHGRTPDLVCVRQIRCGLVQTPSPRKAGARRPGAEGTS